MSHDELVKQFVSAAESYWVEMKSHGSRAANKRTKELESISRRWEESGTVLSTMRLMLANRSATVRCPAALYLLSKGYEQEAIIALEKISSDPVGLVGLAAESFLMARKNQRLLANP